MHSPSVTFSCKMLPDNGGPKFPRSEFRLCEEVAVLGHHPQQAGARSRLQCVAGQRTLREVIRFLRKGVKRQTKGIVEQLYHQLNVVVCLVTLLLRILHGTFQLILNSLDYFEGDYGLGDRGPTRPITYLSSFWRWRHPDSRNTRRYTAQFHAKLFWGRNFCSSRSCHLKLNRLLSYTDILVAQVRIIFIRCP